MLTTPLHPLAEDYLQRLRLAAEGLPRSDRDELVTELRSHLETGLPPDASEADVRNFLENLGAPEEIAAAAREETAPPDPGDPAPVTAGPWGTLEVLAVLGLTVGVFLLPVVGPIAGIGLAWASVRWTRREKVVATALTVLPLLGLVLAGALPLMLMSAPGSVPPDATVHQTSQGAQ